jgi:PAS domain-containing protein
MKVENDLFALENYINDIWQFLPIPVAYLNPMGVILDVSHSFEQMIHFKKEELIGGTLVGLFTERYLMDKIHLFTFK